jgi:ATP-binding cassette subfamily F protein uup
MAVLTLSDACLAFGHVALLDHTAFALETNERVGLIGRNGTGKSSLLKIIAGIDKPDDGQLQLQSGIEVSYVPQEPTFAPGATVFSTVSEGLAETAGTGSSASKRRCSACGSRPTWRSKTCRAA